MNKYTAIQKAFRRIAHKESRIRSFLARSPFNVWPDDRRLERLKDIHQGKRAFIIGNGPSLSVDDLNRLRNEITFASNKIYLAFDRTDWRPTYFVLCDLLVAAQNVRQIQSLKVPKFITNYGRSFLMPCPGTVWFNELSGNYPLTGRSDLADLSPSVVLFSQDVTKGVEGGGTVIFNQLQLAFHMGCSEVVLIGLDFSFETKGLTKTQTFFEKGIVSKGEVNHFHPDYRKPGELWSVPNMELQRLAFKAADLRFKAVGRRIVNASRSTKLDVFPRVDFDALF